MSLQKITMPKLGESVVEGTITSWLIKEGDTVNKYDPIAEVMTDKVNAEIPSSYSGTIKEIVVKEGKTVSVDELICYIETDEKQVENSASRIAEGKTNNEKVTSEDDISMKKRYSPAVLKLAAAHDVNLDNVTGTGMGGRITRKDMTAYIETLDETKKIEENKIEQKQAEEKQKQQEKEPQYYVEEDEDTILVPVNPVRKTIADNMVRSKTEIPHAWMTIEVDVTDLVSLRDKAKDVFREQEGYNLTYFAFFVSVIAKALKEYPELNSTWQGDHIIQHQSVNISIAVAHKNELYVPVIKNADEKSIKGIAKEISSLANKARSGKLSVEDLQGGTFTINNTGTFGSISSMGIINYPQAAILQVESIVKRPVIIDNMFAARDIVNLSLSLDHRILDGLICGRFLQRIKQLLENINEDSTNI